MEVKKKRYNGTGIEYYRNGKIKSKGLYVQNWRQGKHFFYFEDGKLQKEENYVHGEVDGISREYNKSGIKISESNYSNGQLEGALTSYYDDGTLFQSFNFKDGKRDGEQKIFYKSGTLKSIVFYKNGYPGVGLQEYAEDGTLIQQECKILVEEKNLIELNQSYQITCNLTKEQPVRFYLDESKDSQFLSVSLYQIPLKNKVYQHTLKIFPGDFMMTTFHIFALTKSKQGNDLVLSKMVNIAAGS